MTIPTTLFLWVPSVVIAHVGGFLFFIYGLERVSGVVSQTYKRFLGKKSDRSSHAADKMTLATSSLSSSKGGIDGSVSKEHVKALGSAPDPCWVRGCSCQDGCFCSNRWVPANGEKKLAGSTPLAKQALEVRIPAELSWNSLSCTVQDRATMKAKTVLLNSFGTVVPGEMAALVGPSGAGKSTLLDILALRKSTGKLSGTVLMNGLPRGNEFKRISTYVSQEDVFVPTSSLWETLIFNAQLRMSAKTTRAEMETRMQEVLSVMGLWRCRHTQVGGILPGGISVRGLSGGERRRLNISCCLIASPSILFMDEPTTGLDSFAALNVMEYMSHLAKLGHTIIASIHQPRTAIWDMFHKVLVLSEGLEMYFGPPGEVTAWFQGTLGFDYDPAIDGSISDWVMDLVSVGFAKPEPYAARSMTTVAEVQDAAAKFAKNATLPGMSSVPSTASETKLVDAEKGKEASSGDDDPYGGVGDFEGAYGLYGTPDTTGGAVAGPIVAKGKPARTRMQSKFAVGFFRQFQVLFVRAFVAQTRNPADVASRLLMSCWVGLIAGLSFINLPDNVPAVFQRLTMLFFIMNQFELLPFCYMSFYVADRKFFAADVAAGLYHPLAYYLANSISAIPFTLLNTMAGSFTCYGLVGLRSTGTAIGKFTLLQLSQSLVAVQFMIMCVYASPTQDIAYAAAVGYVAVSTFLCGFFLRISEIQIVPLRWLSYTSYPKYVVSAMAWVELEGKRWYPPGCVAQGMPGATQEELRETMFNATQRQAAKAQGFNCEFVTKGESILKYWQFEYRIWETMGILLIFYAIFHVTSYFALSRLYRQRR